MKKRLLLLLLFGFAGLSFVLHAQDDKRKAEFESFKKRRVAFITKKMQLADSEAKGFWLVCDELQEKRFALKQQVKKLAHEFVNAEKGGNTYSEEEYLEIVKRIKDIEIEEALLEREYISRFAEVIPARKIFLYQHAERQFAREMLKKKKPFVPK